MESMTHLEYAYKWEKEKSDSVWLVQPMGGGQVLEITWKRAIDEARRMAAHIKSMNLPDKSRISIFSKNSAWWIITDLAIWMAGHISVPIFPTLTSNTIEQILKHSEAALIFVGKLDGYDSMKDGIPKEMPRITLPLSPKTDDPKWEDIIAGTNPLEGETSRDLDELATIVYTSGSTGTPKGVMHNFRSMSETDGLSDILNISSKDRVLSYLPLAHVFERWIVEAGTLRDAFKVYFAESLDTFVEDLNRCRPTLFISVPRLWQRFQQGVFAKMPPEKLTKLLKIPILKNIVRGKILKGLGLDKCRFAGSGSAPIPADLIDWYRSLGLELLEGYGMTENFSYSHTTLPGQVRVGYVGSANPGVECKISADGEILIKSAGDMMGYYKEPELSKEAFTDDGFLKTGDCGEIDELGRLKITGRIKEQFKTSKGKYVAPAPIENRLQLHRDVEMACVSCNNLPFPYGMVVLSEEARGKINEQSERDSIEATMKEHLKWINSEVDHHENLLFVAVISDDWSIENGFLTPTMKLKRRAIEEKYGTLAGKWSDMKQIVIWV